MYNFDKPWPRSSPVVALQSCPTIGKSVLYTGACPIFTCFDPQSNSATCADIVEQQFVPYIQLTGTVFETACKHRYIARAANHQGAKDSGLRA